MKYIISIGSNIKPHVHVRWILKKFQEDFSKVRVSRFFCSCADGMLSSRLFWNGAVLIDSDMSPKVLKAYLCDMEEKSGRDRSHPQCSLRDRTLDLDICWDEQVGWYISRKYIANRSYLYFPLVSLGNVGEKMLLHSRGKGHSPLQPVFFSLGERLLGGRKQTLALLES